MSAMVNVKRDWSPRDYEDFEHTGPDTLMGQWLRLFWHPVYRSEDLPVGWVKPVRLMNENFALFRGESGAVYMTEPKCAHRLTQLSIGWVTGEAINCRFHGWRYDGNTGRCMAQPLEQRPFSESVTLRTYPLREYLGMIFAYIGEGEAPPFPRYPWLETPDVVFSVTVNYHDYNYFNNRENDPLHTPFTHRTVRGGAFVLPEDMGTIQSRETAWGYSGEIQMANGMRQTLQFGMPLINNVPGGAGVGADAKMRVWTEHIGWKLPVDDEHGVQFIVFAAHVPLENMQAYKERQAELAAKRALAIGDKKRPSIREVAEAVLAGHMRIEDVGPDDVDPPGLGAVMVQDWITQAGQGVIHTDRKKELLASSDATVIMNRRILRRELQALAEGRPLKQWVCDPAQLSIYPRSEEITPELQRAETT